MKKCLFCGTEVPKSTKKCPNCGKKCISKKWLIVIVIFAVILLISIFGSGESTSGGNKTTTTTTKKTYGLNEVATIRTSDGNYRLKITKVKETSERNQFSDIEANRVITIYYEYENVSYEDSLAIYYTNFKVYDKANTLLETYPVLTKTGDSISIGRKATAVDAYALNNEDNYIEIEYYDNMFFGTYDCIFEIEW